ARPVTATATPAPPAPAAAAGGHTGSLTATGGLTRFTLRRDRVRIAVWVVSIALLVVTTAASVDGLFPTQADLDEAAASVHGNAAAIVFNGPDQALDTRGGQIAFQLGTFGMVVVALMSIFTLGRATRGDEEAGRLDLVRSLPVGPHAPTAAALLVVVGMNVVVGTVVALGMLAQDLPTAGSLLFGAGFTAVGLVFAGVTLVAAQVTENTRVVYGASGVVLGAAFVLRAAGDVGDGTLSWLSPIGWAQKARPYAGDRWWPLLVPLVAAAVLVAVAGRLAAHRDVGAGLVPSRPGPPHAAPALGSPPGLALHLQRGALVAWAVGLLTLGVAYGSVADDIDDFVADNDSIRDVVAQTTGVSLTDSYLATSLLMLALIVAGFAVSSALRLRSEETATHAEWILAGPVSRVRWAASHLAVALAGSAVVMASTGLGVGLSYGLAAGDLGQVPRLVAASLAYVPALWALVGVTLVLFGLVPRATSVAWAALALCWVVGLLGTVFDFPAWVDDASPFQHVPQVPAVDPEALPLVATLAVAAGLLVVGLAGFRRRDVG
ncbi:MAG TPA: hypothetical protein VF743_06950, partial [Acidimicrobiales bacterium]